MERIQLEVDMLYPFKEPNRLGLVLESGSVRILSNSTGRALDFHPTEVIQHLKMSFNDWLKYTKYLYN